MGSSPILAAQIALQGKTLILNILTVHLGGLLPIPPKTVKERGRYQQQLLACVSWCQPIASLHPNPNLNPKCFPLSRVEQKMSFSSHFSYGGIPLSSQTLVFHFCSFRKQSLTKCCDCSWSQPHPFLYPWSRHANWPEGPSILPGWLQSSLDTLLLFSPSKRSSFHEDFSKI